MKANKYMDMTQFQAQVIPLIMEKKDMIVRTTDNTYRKALVYAVPILEYLSQLPPIELFDRQIRVLILAPSHHLVDSIYHIIHTLIKETRLTIMNGNYFAKSKKKRNSRPAMWIVISLSLSQRL